MITLFWTIAHTGIGYKHTAYRSAEDHFNSVDFVYSRIVNKRIDHEYMALLSFVRNEGYIDELALYILSQLYEVEDTLKIK